MTPLDCTGLDAALDDMEYGGCDTALVILDCARRVPTFVISPGTRGPACIVISNPDP
jgi:hypothetical protein